MSDLTAPHWPQLSYCLSFHPCLRESAVAVVAAPILPRVSGGPGVTKSRTRLSMSIRVSLSSLLTSSLYSFALLVESKLVKTILALTA